MVEALDDPYHTICNCVILINYFSVCFVCLYCYTCVFVIVSVFMFTFFNYSTLIYDFYFNYLIKQFQFTKLLMTVCIVRDLVFSSSHWRCT